MIGYTVFLKGTPVSSLGQREDGDSVFVETSIIIHHNTRFRGCSVMLVIATVNVVYFMCV